MQTKQIKSFLFIFEQHEANISSTIEDRPFWEWTVNLKSGQTISVDQRYHIGFDDDFGLLTFDYHSQTLCYRERILVAPEDIASIAYRQVPWSNKGRQDVPNVHVDEGHRDEV